MVRFAHLGDCHLGSWKQPELQDINFLCFAQAIDKCIEEQLDFILIAGDLFDSAYPPVEILKKTFAEFRKLKEAKIPCYLIAGSHDYSVSGKTFLDVLEKAGFCSICKYNEHKNEEGKVEKITLDPLNHKGLEIYGYPGKKSGLEVQDLKKVELPETQNMRILMIHSSITEAVGDLPIESIGLEELPKAEYYALAHLHIDFEKEIDGRKAIYSGPIFPNSFQELEDLGRGSFFIVEMEGFTQAKKQILSPKEIVKIKIEIEDALTGTQKILSELEKYELEDKIVLLRLHGQIKQGNNSDINYNKIREYLEEKKAYSFLKNTHKLGKQELESQEIQFSDADIGKAEERIASDYGLKNPSKFNNLILPLTNSLDLNKQEDEKSTIFEERLCSELNKVLGLEIK